MSYQLIKSFHVIFVVSWFAGLFYIFRLFVYHVENWNELKVHSLFCKMEGRLLRYIMFPASALSLFFGTWMLILNPTLLSQVWIHLKLTLVLFLISYHAYSYYIHRQLAQRKLVISSKACRLINEIPTVVLIVVCILAFTKPLLT